MQSLCLGRQSGSEEYAVAQDLSIEDPNLYFFITIRTIGSRLWFINNPLLTEKVVAFLAKYQERYGVELFSFVIMGNHYHLIGRFPGSNKSVFLKSFNSIFARLTASTVTLVPGGPSFPGPLWARRARSQILPLASDVEDRFFYCALNPVISGVVSRISDYTNYNSFSDAIAGRRRTFRLVDWTEYRNRKRTNKKLRPKDCEYEYTLRYSRLPGYELTPSKLYHAAMLKKLEERRQEEIQKRTAAGKGFATPALMTALTPGAEPKSTKTSTRDSHRPLFLTRCSETLRTCLSRYFALLAAYREASRRYRAGDLTAAFPPGTYKPCILAPPV